MSIQCLLPLRSHPSTSNSDAFLLPFLNWGTLCQTHKASKYLLTHSRVQQTPKNRLDCFRSSSSLTSCICCLSGVSWPSGSFKVKRTSACPSGRRSSTTWWWASSTSSAGSMWRRAPAASAWPSTIPWRWLRMWHSQRRGILIAARTPPTPTPSWWCVWCPAASPWEPSSCWCTTAGCTLTGL